MSEYQYFEWLCLDRPLSLEEQRAVDKLSSHITVSSTGAWVDYSWGDFKHDPKQVLARYFDAFLYESNWNTKELMFRFPRTVLDPLPLQPYLIAHGLTLDEIGDYYVLAFSLEDEAPNDWVDDGGLLAALAPLRTDILHDDLRCLYIVHSHLVESGYVDEMKEGANEVPIPPGMHKLTPALRSMMEFFHIEPPKVGSDAQADVDPQAERNADLENAIHRLPREEVEAFLCRLLRDEPLLLSVTLRRRLRELL